MSFIFGAFGAILVIMGLNLPMTHPSWWNYIILGSIFIVGSVILRKLK